MTTTYQRFLQLLSPREHLNCIYNAYDLSVIDKNATEYNVKQLAYVQLQNYLKLCGGNDEIKKYLQKKRLFFITSVAYGVRYQYLQDSLISLLNDNDIPVTVLKGSAIAQQLYNNINTRISCDIDLLVKERDIERVHKLLLNEKFIWNASVSLEFLRVRLHHTTYFRPDQINIPVEVHWNFSIPGFFKLSSEDIWAETIISNKGRYSLTPEMSLTLLLMHHHRHAFKELRNIVDLLWAFYRFENDISWIEYAKWIQRIGLQRTSLFTIHQLEKLWPEETKHLNGLQEFKNAINKHGKQTLFLRILAAPNLNIGKSELTTRDRILYRLALDSLIVLFFSFIKSLIPPPHAINELYGKRHGIYMFFNYFRYIRWRFFEKKS